jgi:hypothetical protein
LASFLRSPDSVGDEMRDVVLDHIAPKTRTVPELPGDGSSVSRFYHQRAETRDFAGDTITLRTPPRCPVEALTASRPDGEGNEIQQITLSGAT